MTNIFIVAAKRTPFGAFGGSLKKLTATELGTHATQAAISSANLDPSTIDAVYFGNVIQSSSDAAYLARHVGLKCGVPSKSLKVLIIILSLRSKTHNTFLSSQCACFNYQ